MRPYQAGSPGTGSLANTKNILWPAGLRKTHIIRLSLAKEFFINDSIENRISYYHLWMFVVSLPFDRFYSTAILMSFCCHIAIYFHPGALKKITGTVLILQSVFF